MPTEITGNHYDGKTSLATPAILEIQEDGTLLLNGTRLANLNFRQLEVPHRVGNTPRSINLHEHGLFETRDNATLDELLDLFHDNSKHKFLYNLEKNPTWLITLLLATLLAFYLAISQGIPRFSLYMANKLPTEWSGKLAQGAMEEMDKYYFEKSNLPGERKQALQKLFIQYLPEDSPFEFKLHFRSSEMIGANAFALPDGSVVITDELVHLTDNNTEILSVLLHEIGHVEERHALRSLIESSSLALLLLWFSGDSEFVVEWITALPPLLLHASFSRDHEWEADTYSLKQMQLSDIDPVHFSTMMEKMMETSQENQETRTDNQKEADETTNESTPNAEDTENDKVSNLLNYLSTHPPSKERIERFRKASETQTD